MKNLMIALLGAALMLTLLATACGGGEPPAPPPPAPPMEMHLAFFQPMPDVMEAEAYPVTEEKVTLGRMLYYDTRLSASGEFSCNSCHMLDKYGVDGEPTSPGHDGQRGVRNSPTVYNAAAHVTQFWDGREPDVEAQAKGPVLNPVEMAMPSAKAVEKVLKGVDGYGPLFAAAFPEEKDPVTFDNMALAIGSFERGLVTPSRFDAYLAGDGGAITAEERAGAQAFIDATCTTCHMGPLLGGNMYQKMGLIKPYESADKGRGDLTGEEQDNYFFKVPTLRNIAETGPYMHDGSIASLKEVVDLMVEHQVAVPVTEAQAASIILFLETLTGKIPEEYVAKPELPN